jgi:poly-gamma-glutamate capsule biosynthesis protein CapA/YwtB (metallophosphatase superfamily)
MERQVNKGLAVVALLLETSRPVLAEGATGVTLAFVGDIMLDSLPGEAIAKGEDPFAGFAAALADADAAVGNLECPIAVQGAPFDKIFTFRAHPRVLRVLASHFAAFSLANNHSGDYGKGALLETMAGLSGEHVAFFGAGLNLTAAHRALMLERAGIRIALLGYDEFQPRAFEAGVDTAGVAWSEQEQVVTDIRAARALGADIVIPFMHWGWEHEGTPCPRQRELAHVMLDAGADAVVGGHPHVTQGAEIYRGKPILYSLGNFVFDGFEEPAARTGWLLRLHVDKHGIVKWETLVARLDERGLPSPDVEAISPCGDASALRSCRAGQPTLPK